MATVADGPPTEGYTRAEALRILSIDPKLLRRWERDGLLERRGRYEFSNLRELRTLARLHRKIARHSRGKRLKAILSQLKRLPGVRRPLLDAKYVWDAPGVVVEDEDGNWVQPDTQQLVFNYGPIPPSRTQAIRTLPEPAVSPARAEEAEGWFQHGLEVEENGGSPDEARQAYQRAVELNPDAAGAWLNLGTLLYRDGDLRAAEKHYRRASEIAPAYALAHFNLGNVCEELDRPNDAIQAYEEALRHEAGYADAHYNLALVYERQGEPMRAAKHWRAYLILDPKSPWAGIARQQLRALIEVKPGGMAGSR